MGEKHYKVTQKYLIERVYYVEANSKAEAIEIAEQRGELYCDREYISENKFKARTINRPIRAESQEVKCPNCKYIFPCIVNAGDCDIFCPNCRIYYKWDGNSKWVYRGYPVGKNQLILEVIEKS